MTPKHLLLTACALLVAGLATAQHGLSMDIGQHHPEDSTHTTYFNIGLTSFADTLHGVQLNGVSNLVDKAKGVQVAGFSNIATSPFRGLQFSGVSNIARGVEHGLQLAALLNVSSGYMRGAQMAFYNYADTLNGSQLGIFNVALRHPKGWQIGVVNYSRDTLAHKIGLVNVNPNTVVDFMAYGGSSSKLNAALRFRNRSTYSVLGFGTHYMGFDEKFSGAFFYRIGQYFQLSPRWSLSGDVGYYHIETFERHSADKPERFFSLQARVNVDYQISQYIGAFASAGWGDTRYYHHARSYRSRPLVEAGLTFRYQHNMLRENAATWVKKKQAATDSLMAPGLGQRHPWWALAEVTGINVGVQLFDRYATREEFAQTTLRSIRRNLTGGFVWDNDLFTTNMFMHPYHGNLYFNAARSQGLNFWQSAPYAALGSLQWELLGETEPPAINDLIATTFGGITIGEVTRRISHIILNDSRRGWRRFWTEAAATLVNPMGALKRLSTGDAWRVRTDHYRYHDYLRNPVDFAVSVGTRYLADNGSMFRGEYNPYVNLYMEYGDPVNEGDHNQPYDFFDLEATFGLSSNQPVINQLHLIGRLWSTPMIEGRKLTAEFGLYQHFDYFDSKPVKDGSSLTPYRMSEVAAVGPGVILQQPEVGTLSRLEQRLFLTGILLGGTKSDYFNIIERDYNMGSGFSVKSKTHLEMRHFGRFILHAQYYQLFTWRGYENKDLSTVDLYHLNAQGDKSNARLLVINPILEFDLRRNWSLTFAGTSYLRRTHYKYYDNVRANTFDFRIGLTAHL